MVYRGKPSKGCTRCRKKKTKCDQVHPECGQCTRYGFKCPGYRSELDLMFLDESSSVGEKAQKAYAAQGSSKTTEGDNKTAIGRKLFLSRLRKLGNPEVLGAAMADPFQTCAVELNADMQRLFHSFLKSEPDLIPLASPTPMKTVWLPTIISDPLVFYSMLSHSVRRGDDANSSMYLRQRLEYESKLFSMLNERFEDPKRRVTEETLIAVLGLAGHAIAAGEEAAAHLHMNGLSRMVAIGGGLANMAITGVLKEAIFWAGLCYAFSYSQPPNPGFFLPPSKPQFNSIPLAMYCVRSSSLAFLGSGFKFLPETVRWKEFYAVVHELRCQAIILDLAHLHRRWEGESSLLVDRLKFVEEQLVRLGEVDQSTSKMEDGKDVDQSMESILQVCRLATVVFLHCSLNHYIVSQNPQLHELLASGIQALLINGEISWETLELERLRIWIVFMGVMVSKRTVMETWFEREFAYTIRALSMHDAAEVREVLATFLWVSSSCDGAFKELWGKTEVEDSGDSMFEEFCNEIPEDC